MKPEVNIFVTQNNTLYFLGHTKTIFVFLKGTNSDKNKNTENLINNNYERVLDLFFGILTTFF